MANEGVLLTQVTKDASATRARRQAQGKDALGQAGRLWGGTAT